MRSNFSKYKELLIKTEINDYRLVQRVQKGDKKSFDLLVLRYQQRVTAVVGRYNLSSDEIKDITQETFIKAYRSIDRFRGESKFYTWLYRIAINSTKNHLIAKSRRPPDVDIDVSEITSLLQSTTGPESEFEAERLDQVVQTAISKLPQELKVAMIMREYEGMSYEDISSIMECPIGTVRSRIFRAREAIEREIKSRA
ncbi:MAG: RNA polymerase sigma factor RpoE [Pseudomonadota bacterium]|nr:RNA polymerase sigma factor RpoE [Pseudomonadota bacterium]